MGNGKAYRENTNRRVRIASLISDKIRWSGRALNKTKKDDS